MATEIKCEKKVIREIFNMWYCIPDYQRAYVWDTDQVRDLLDDTISAYRENKEAQYFLGSMVLKINEKSENNVSYTEYELLDGPAKNHNGFSHLSVHERYAYRLSAISEFVSRFCLSGGGCHFTAAGTDADYI